MTKPVVTNNELAMVTHQRSLNTMKLHHRSRGHDDNYRNPVLYPTANEY